MGLSGAQAEDLMHAVNITANKNLIPYDQRPPMEASGVRLGTAAVTTRGLGHDEMVRMGNWIADVLANPSDDALAASIRKEVAEVTSACPIYP